MLLFLLVSAKSKTMVKVMMLVMHDDDDDDDDDAGQLEITTIVPDGDDDIDGKDDSEDDDGKDCESSVTVVNQPPSHVSISADTLENHSPFYKKEISLLFCNCFLTWAHFS